MVPPASSPTHALLCLAVAVLLAACGGGGGSAEGNAGGSAGSQTQGSGSGAGAGAAAGAGAGGSGADGTAAPGSPGTTSPLAGDAGAQAAARDGSHWRLNDHVYANGGRSEQLPAPLFRKTGTVLVISSAPASDGEHGHGAYAGSVLKITLSDQRPGSYTVVPDMNTVVLAEVGESLAHVEAQLGTARNSGSTVYVAASGRLEVSAAADGHLHVSTPEALPAHKGLEVLGGIDGAPDQMQLWVHDAY